MANVERVIFEEIDQQWLVTLVDDEGATVPGEPFPASGHENYSKLEQVLDRLTLLGYRARQIPHEAPNQRRYVFDVRPLDR
ncbi:MULTISPECIES: hypothetical protein [unclassified Microbacterium]|uniref:hypothetical protein n=1 Tax=unclassified Microbacterium TaxID=2609290 RepID=UPI000492F710|nr:MULTISPECIES: hypothetical protein [unclassified Microbacterium]